MALETVPIDNEKASNKQPMKIEVSGLDAWKGHRFTITFDWNPVMGRWKTTITHENSGNEFFNGIASLYREMNLQSYIYFMFLDPSKKSSKVSADNLGDDVLLAIIPGSESESESESDNNLEL